MQPAPEGTGSEGGEPETGGRDVGTRAAHEPETLALLNLDNPVGFISDLNAGILTAEVATVHPVIRSYGAPSIAQGRTPHEVQDELCMRVDLGRS